MLKYAIAELLSRRPLTGYELKKRFDSSITFFWHAEHSQIYAELKRMKKDGLVTFTVEQQDGRPNRKVYRLTAQGLAELRDWLAQPSPLHELKDEMLVKSFAFDLIDPQVAADQLMRYKRLCEERLASYEAIRDKLIRRYGPISEITNPGLFCSYLNLTQGIAHEKMYIEWCGWAAQQCQFMAENAARFHVTDDAHGVESALYDAVVTTQSTGPGS